MGGKVNEPNLVIVGPWKINSGKISLTEETTKEQPRERRVPVTESYGHQTKGEKKKRKKIGTGRRKKNKG